MSVSPCLFQLLLVSRCLFCLCLCLVSLTPVLSLSLLHCMCIARPGWCTFTPWRLAVLDSSFSRCVPYPKFFYTIIRYIVLSPGSLLSFVFPLSQFQSVFASTSIAVVFQYGGEVQVMDIYKNSPQQIRLRTARRRSLVVGLLVELAAAVVKGVDLVLVPQSITVSGVQASTLGGAVSWVLPVSCTWPGSSRCCRDSLGAMVSICCSTGIA